MTVGIVGRGVWQAERPVRALVSIRQRAAYLISALRQAQRAWERNGRIVCMTEATHPKLDELISTTALLRAPGGCAWDAEQTHASLVQYLVEETYELVDAIESGTRDDLIEELGDVLYQVVFHAEIASQTPGEEFTIEDVAANTTAKMISRHPHVFGDEAEKATLNIRSGNDVSGMWDELKKADKPHRTSVLDGIPQGMPALALADKVLGKAEKIGILDADAPGALTLGSEEELGGVLLAIVTSARLNGLDSERALRTVLRSLQDEIREVEALGAVDAGIIGFETE